MSKNPSCHICDETLTDDELTYFNENDLTILTENEYRCEKHWCPCMPKMTPWKYLTSCDICENAICKTCKRESFKGNLLCDDCYDCLNSRGRI